MAALTESHRRGGINHRNLLLTALEAGESEIKVGADSGSGGGPLPAS